MNQFFVAAKSNIGVVVGTCVVLSKKNELVYAGPIRTVPVQPDVVVVLNPADLEDLRVHIERRTP